jgi:hypothetical protein
MVGIGFIGFLGFVFVGMTAINQMLAGAMIGSADMGIMNNLTLFKSLSVFGLFQLSVPNLSFITEGIPHLVKWDYSFFAGNAGIIQFFLYSLTLALAFGLFLVMISMLYSFANRLR